MRYRTSLVIASSLTVLALVLASCAPAAAPAPAPKAAPAAPTAAQPKPAAAPEAKAAPAAPAATPKPAVEQPKYGGLVTRMRDKYPDTLDPHLNRGALWSNDVLGPVYSGLLMLNEKMEIVPDLAEKWEQPSDTAYVLHLRRGIKFHDTPVMKGRELTAEDVKYNIQRMATEDPKFFSRWKFQVVSNIETPDKYTVKLTLKEPTAPFLDFLAQPANYMVGREAVEKSGDLNREEAGTGPFYLKSWTEKVSYKLAKYPSYFIKGIPYFDEINVVIVPDPASRLAAFRSGRADVTLVSSIELGALKQTNPRVTSASLPSAIVMMIFHPEKRPFTDQRVRQAFSLAIDRQALVDVVMEGRAEITGPIYGVAASWQLPMDEVKRLYKPDLAQAKKLMTEAGYPDGFPLEVKISSARKDSVESVVVVAQQLKQIGVEIKQQVMEHTTLIAQRDKADYAALLHGGTATLEPGERIEQYWRPGGMYHLKDPELASLLNEQRKTVDVAKRRQILNRFERLWIERAYALMLFGYGEYLVRQPHIKGPYQGSVIGQHMIAYNWSDK
ncbi:MAG: ABC transporter substrate-binding protein [Chloroflexi bacterium]|nr:ABC transporter substrate-binding protein [Chloroflexota bacterium]